MSAPNWLATVAVAHRSGTEIWSDGKRTVRRVSGGMNNALYHVASGGEEYAYKLCVADERRRAQREYGALHTLQQAALDLAPRPVLLDTSCSILPLPVVVYRWLPGQSLRPPLTSDQLAALLRSIQAVHSIRRAPRVPSALTNAIFHWFDVGPYLAELRGFLARYGGWLAAHELDGQKLRSRLAVLLARCTDAMSSSAACLGRNCVPLCLCRVDPNLANTVWDGSGRMRWVDWEYAGWGDPALDLADLRWHVSLDGVTEDQHDWLRTHYPRPAGDGGFDARLAAWDTLLATRWPFLLLRALWSTHNGPERVRLTSLASEPAELRARFLASLQQAEACVP